MVGRVSKIAMRILLVCLVFCASCIRREPKESLTLDKQNANDVSALMNGYYYYKNGDEFTIYFLYRDGTAIYAGTFESSDLTSVESELSSRDFSNRLPSIPWAWGIFVIEKDVIKIEHLYPSSGNYHAGIRGGTLINDSTFKIHKVQRTREASIVHVDETYRFKKFHQKPDSSRKQIE